MKIWFQWFFRLFSDRVLFSRVFWTIATLNRVSWNDSEFLLPFFNILDTVEAEIFFFCACPVIFWHGSFSNAILMASWFMPWGLPDRGLFFRDYETFNHCFIQWTVVLLTFSCFEISIFLKPACNKVYISILVVSIRRLDV